MERKFTTKRDLIRAFAGAMNLISPEIQNHHEKTAYLSYRLAEAMNLDEMQRTLVLAGGLLHDIGGILQQGKVSLSELEMHSEDIAAIGASFLERFPETKQYAPAVRESQTSWKDAEGTEKACGESFLLGQIVHLADAVSLLLNDDEPVLNQIAEMRKMICSEGKTEFCPEVLSAFDRLCTIESVWLDAIYHPQGFLDLLPDNPVTMDETVKLTEFMSKLIDYRSPFTAMHSAGVASTAVSLAELAGMSEEECRMMRIAGYLHDLGKLKIPDEILEKPGKLTDEEFNVIKEHAYFTWVLLRDVSGFEEISAWAALHHEKLNGNGYPFHLPGREIPLGSRIMTVADIFSATTEDRPYRKSMDSEKVKSILREDAGQGRLSGRLVSLLIENYDSINEKRAAESKAASQKYQEILAAQTKKTA